MKETQHFEKVIEWVNNRGFLNVKANVENFETPTSYSSSNNIEFIPDITGVKSDKKFYFEIVERTTDVSIKTSKWKLLSTLAALKGGKLILFIPRGLKSFTERLVKKYDINAQLVYLPSIK